MALENRWTREQVARAAGVAPAAIGGGESAPLRGIVIRDSSDTLVVRASAEEVDRFAARQGAEVAVLHPEMVMRLGHVPAGEPVTDQATAGTVSPGDTLYDGMGRPVAIIEHLESRVDAVDVTSHGDMYQTFTQGRRELRISAVGLVGAGVGLAPRFGTRGSRRPTTYVTSG